MKKIQWKLFIFLEIESVVKNTSRTTGSENKEGVGQDSREEDVPVAGGGGCEIIKMFSKWLSVTEDVVREKG